MSYMGIFLKDRRLWRCGYTVMPIVYPEVLALEIAKRYLGFDNRNGRRPTAPFPFPVEIERAISPFP